MNLFINKKNVLFAILSLLLCSGCGIVNTPKEEFSPSTQRFVSEDSVVGALESDPVIGKPSEDAEITQVSAAFSPSNLGGINPAAQPDNLFKRIGPIEVNQDYPINACKNEPVESEGPTGRIILQSSYVTINAPQMDGDSDKENEISVSVSPTPKANAACEWLRTQYYECEGGINSAGHAFIGVANIYSCSGATDIQLSVEGINKDSDLGEFTKWINGNNGNLCVWLGKTSDATKRDQFKTALEKYIAKFGVDGMIFNVVVPFFTRPCKRIVKGARDLLQGIID